MNDPLVERAREAQRHAHAPYSGFRVGAALETEDGRVFTGANVENVSYGVTTCAERVALGAAVTAGARRFRRMVIVTDAERATAPCGACRQALAEFNVNMPVESVGRSSTKRWTVAALLPDAFGPDDIAH
jgi:cytidine deaminase